MRTGWGNSMSDIAMHSRASITSMYTRGMGLFIMLAMFSVACEGTEMVQSCICAYVSM